MPQIQLLDGKKIKFEKSISGFDLTKKISKSLEKNALIMEVDGNLKDLSHQITKDAKVRIITPKDKEGLEIQQVIFILMTNQPVQWWASNRLVVRVQVERTTKQGVL